MAAPRLINAIPQQVINELAGFHPFNLQSFFESDTPIRFSAQQTNGEALPKGMICTSEGMLTGIPAKGTVGAYQLIITAQNETGETNAEFTLLIRESLVNTETGTSLEELKAQIWDAADKNLPIPDLSELLNREVTPIEIYYLLERWAMLKIWDAFNLDVPGALTPITVEGASPHYATYDRGSCLVAIPKDLFSHERTTEDAFMTARALAREAYSRGWTMDLVGFDKLIRAAWVEVQRLNQIHGRNLEVVNYTVKDKDVKLFNEIMRKEAGIQPGLEAGE